jgi:hypothetical protein
MVSHEIAGKLQTRHLGRIIRFISLSTPTRFVSICEDAIACFWSSKMTCTAVVHMDSKLFISPRASLRVTDGAYLPNANRIILATNARDIRFHHATSGQMTHKMYVPEIVLTMVVHIDENKPDKCTLAFGDFKGCVTAIEFYKASTDLFEPPKAWCPRFSARFCNCPVLWDARCGGFEAPAMRVIRWPLG